MKKTSKRALTALAALAVFTFSGCGQAMIPTETAAPLTATMIEATKTMRLKPVPLSFSAGEQDMPNAADEQDEATLLDATEDEVEATAPEAQESDLQSQADALPAQENPEPTAQPEQQGTTNTPAPAPVPAPAPAPTPAPAPAPAFDVSACVQNVMNYGVGIGLALDSTATACWDNPTTANERTLYVERDLRDTLDWYKASGFTAFWVWDEEDGNGGYLVYIGYA